jgi:hypothetical protein
MKQLSSLTTRVWPPRRVLFTLIIAGLLFVGAVVSGSLFHPLTPAWQDRLGFAPSDLFTPRWDRIFSSALVTSGGTTFWLAFALMIALVLIAESLTGSNRAALSFWFGHLGASIGGALIIGLARIFSNSAILDEIYTLRDVGPSAGYFGCMGLLAACIPRPWKYLVGLAVIAGLIGGMIYSALYGATLDVAAGLSHLIAFPLGWGIAAAPFLNNPRA